MMSVVVARALLGSDPEDGQHVLRRRWRNLAKTHHPDRGGDPAMFLKITEAYQLLSNPQIHRGAIPAPRPSMQISGPAARVPREMDPYYWSDQEWLENEFGHLGWWNRDGLRRRG